jgi:hypothetical protein
LSSWSGPSPKLQPQVIEKPFDKFARALLGAPAQIAISLDALTDFVNFRLKPDAEPLQQVTPCRLMGSGRE